MPGTPRDIPYLEDKFQTGDIPTQTDFYDLFASFVHYLKVKQEGGSSTTDVMSQKAVTDLVNPLFANQAANRFYCGPDSGAAAAPGFRAIAAGDVPFVYKNDGNAFGADAVLGLNDNFGLAVRTNGVNRYQISASGHHTFTSTLVANANNEILNAVVVNPIFNVGAFLGVRQRYLSLGVSGTGTYFDFNSDVSANAGQYTWDFRASSSTSSARFYVGRLEFNDGGFGTQLSAAIRHRFAIGSNSIDTVRIISTGVGIGLGNVDPTARLMVRGAGSTTGELFRLDDNIPTNRFLMLDNGDTTITGKVTVNKTVADDAVQHIVGNTTNGFAHTLNNFSSSNKLVGYGNGSVAFEIVAVSSPTASRLDSMRALGWSVRNMGGDNAVVQVLYLGTGSVANSIAPLDATVRNVVTSTIAFASSQGVAAANVNFLKYSGSWTKTGTSTGDIFRVFHLKHSIDSDNGSMTAIGLDYDPLVDGTVGLSHYGVLIRHASAFNGFGLGATMPTALIDVAASSASRAGFRLRPGPAPSAPNNGDIWLDDTSHTMHVRINGVTKAFTLT